MKNAVFRYRFLCRQCVKRGHHAAIIDQELEEKKVKVSENTISAIWISIHSSVAVPARLLMSRSIFHTLLNNT